MKIKFTCYFSATQWAAKSGGFQGCCYHFPTHVLEICGVFLLVPVTEAPGDLYQIVLYDKELSWQTSWSLKPTLPDIITKRFYIVLM